MCILCIIAMRKFCHARVFNVRLITVACNSKSAGGSAATSKTRWQASDSKGDENLENLEGTPLEKVDTD